jgi:sugar phosphate isomerase/epimerase
MKITRRRFIQQVAAVSGSATILNSNQLLANPMREPLGFQTYEIFQHLAEDWDGTWQKMASYGYKVADFVQLSFNPKLANKTPQDVTRSLKAAGLTCTNGTFLADLFAKDYAGTVKYAHDLNLQTVVSAYMRPKPTVEAWKGIAGGLNELAVKLQKDGLKLWYHNHEVEFVAVEGQVPWDILMANTDPNLVSFQIDVGNLSFGGADAIQYLSKYPGRYVSMHCKDYVKGKASVPVGQGSLDWKKIFAIAKQQNIRSYYAEVGAYGINTLDGVPLEPSKLDVLESFRQSAEFLKKVRT